MIFGGFFKYFSLICSVDVTLLLLLYNNTAQESVNMVADVVQLFISAASLC